MRRIAGARKEKATQILDQAAQALVVLFEHLSPKGINRALVMLFDQDSGELRVVRQEENGKTPFPGLSDAEVLAEIAGKVLGANELDLRQEMRLPQEHRRILCEQYGEKLRKAQI